MIATAFMGYNTFRSTKLMGISVITSLFSVVPFVTELVQWLWVVFQ
jgi:quinol-cytochrome oxidoreductase complex cytochrome b subunit